MTAGTAAAVWLPTIVGLAVPLLVLGALWVRGAARRRRGPDEDPGSDDGPGGTRRPRPTPTLPTGPVSWPDFERDFAAYAARVERERVGPPGDDDRAGTPRPGDTGS
jgi:hypothetical protein